MNEWMDRQTETDRQRGQLGKQKREVVSEWEEGVWITSIFSIKNLQVLSPLRFLTLTNIYLIINFKYFYIF